MGSPHLTADPLPAHRLLAQTLQTTLDLLRTPALPDQPPDPTPQCFGQLAGHTRGLAAAGTGHGLGLIVPIAALSPVARDLAADRGRTPVQVTGDAAHRKPLRQQDPDLASFLVGQLVVALVHDCSP